MTIVSVDDLIRHMSNVNLSDEQREAAQLVLDGTQAELETYIARPIEPVLVQEVARATEDGHLRATITPVLKVISVTSATGSLFPIPASPVVVPLDSAAAAAAGVERFEDFSPGTFTEPAEVTAGGLPMGIPGLRYALRYVGGLVSYDLSQFKLAILNVAARTVQVYHDDAASVRRGVIDENTELPAPKVGWTQDELKRFDRYRRRIVV